MKQLSWTEEYSNSYFSVEKTEEAFLDEDNGIYNPYYRINNSPSVICYVLNPEDKVLMVEQFRPNLGQFTLELPAGGIYVGSENNMQAAFRELKEETGWNSSLMQIGNEYWTTINRNKSPDYGFVGVATDFDQNNKVEINTTVKQISRNKFSSLIVNGTFTQLTALGLIYAASKVFRKDLLDISYSELRELIG